MYIVLCISCVLIRERIHRQFLMWRSFLKKGIQKYGKHVWDFKLMCERLYCLLSTYFSSFTHCCQTKTRDLCKQNITLVPDNFKQTLLINVINIASLCKETSVLKNVSTPRQLVPWNSRHFNKWKTPSRRKQPNCVQSCVHNCMRIWTCYIQEYVW